MLISYFAELPNDTAIPATAVNLLKDYRFLDKDPESTAAPTQEGRFKLPFLYELVGTTHMSDITGYVPINGLTSKEYAMGKNGAGVIAIACAAVGFYLT